MHNLPPKNWRMQKSKYRLLGGCCLKCKLITYPAKTVCPKCRAIGKTKDYLLQPYGKIISLSEVYVAPTGFEKFVPYTIVIIKLTKGPLMLSQLTDYKRKDVRIGTKVEAVFRKISDFDTSGIIQYGIKFKPVK
ncbi:Zn-ribbon domain-containing OB-fold protein [Candidatus Woesebacteria bacterium]|nr:MAG: Zn-ribbon domain-containing OB-fold protein [Candidatus Woesebacteria bacterium]